MLRSEWLSSEKYGLTGRFLFNVSCNSFKFSVAFQNMHLCSESPFAQLEVETNDGIDLVSSLGGVSGYVDDLNSFGLSKVDVGDTEVCGVSTDDSSPNLSLN